MRQAELRAAIHEYLHQQHMYGRFDGAALIAEAGTVIYEGGFGWANAEWQIPNGPEVKYRVGSITKQFTAVLVLQLVDEGRISLDATVADYLPYYRPDTGRQVTIHQLLNHTSGIPSYTGLPGFGAKVSRQPFAVEPFVRAYCSGDLEFVPGTEFAYNNSGYFILGAIVETITGETYSAALRQRILDPIGMEQTGYDQSEPLLPKRASGYDRDLAGNCNTGFLDMSLPYAAGAMYSTVCDMHLWDRELYGDQLLSKQAKAAMFAPGLSNYGYGWGILRLRPEHLGRYSDPMAAQPDPDGVLLIGHGGKINGFAADFTRQVDDQRVIVLLSNTGAAPVDTMSTDILCLLHGQPIDPPKQPAAPLLYPVLADEGVETALAQYWAWHDQATTRYDTGEGELLALARHCQHQERGSEAELVLREAIVAFPTSDDASIQLGIWLLGQQGRRLDGMQVLRSLLDRSGAMANAQRRQLEAIMQAKDG